MRVWNGSGTWSLLDRGEFPYDVYVHKTITRHPRSPVDAEPRRIDGGGWINKVGLAGPGIDVFVDQILPLLRLRLSSRQELAISVFGETPEEWIYLVGKLGNSYWSPDYIELNLSCPNVLGGLVQDYRDVISTTKWLMRRLSRDLPSPPRVLAKLAPNATVKQAMECEAAGADMLVLCNSMMVDSGALSGPPIREDVIALISRVAPRVGIPIVGLGGVRGPQDYGMMVAAGATDVGIGSANLFLFD